MATSTPHTLMLPTGRSVRLRSLCRGGGGGGGPPLPLVRSSQASPEFCCKDLPLSLPRGQNARRLVPRRSFSQLPDKHFLRAQRTPRPARTWPGPSPPSHTSPPERGPPALPPPVPTAGSPDRLPPGGGTPPAPSARRSAADPEGQGRQTGSPPQPPNPVRETPTPRRPPEAGDRAPVSTPGRGQAAG